MQIHRFPRLAAILVAIAASPASRAGEGPVTFFSEAQLEQMAAPIALYPDALLMQILMAATYPIEIVQADRWLQANPGLSGPALEEGLRYRDWDPSVKSLCTFPDVLRRLDENLDWTGDLGDAFIGQQAELLEAVQRLRAAARRAGNLPDDDPVQRVIVGEDRIIVIQPARPEVIFIPVYHPVVVFGPAWTFPRWYYPHLFIPPPPGVVVRSYGAGIAVGFTIWGGCRWSWGHHQVHIDVERYARFTRVVTARPERHAPPPGPGGWARWEHDPGHRRGVGYRQPEVARRYEGAARPAPVPREQARGYPYPPRPGTPPAPPPAPSIPGGRDPRPKGGPATAPGGGIDRPGPAAGTRSPGAGAPRPAAGSRGNNSGLRSRLGSESAFSGTAQPRLDRAASARGAASKTGGASRQGGPQGKAQPPRGGAVPRVDGGRK